ncbi:hypothetical protein N7467_006050 [Penicillium canescens]|nr:hypothetical protein N7467_006050 [Penicillium canescens]
MATMAWTKVVFLLPFFWLQLACVHSYNIDKSCDSIKSKLETAVQKSMALAKLSFDELGGDDPNVKELRGWFFLDKTIDQVKMVYHNVQEFGTLNKADTDDVMQPTIYCDLSRYEETTRKTKDGKDEPALFDKERKTVSGLSKEYKGCKTGDTVAYRSRTERLSDKKILHNDIQICPWYLAVLGHSPFTNLDNLPDRTGKPSYDPTRAFSNGEPKANVFASRLDVTLLHEFTHALPDYAGSTLDHAYKWTDCTTVGNREVGCMNADSYSYFATGVDMIKVRGFKFTKEGGAQKINKATKRAEQLVMKPWNA